MKYLLTVAVSEAILAEIYERMYVAFMLYLHQVVS
jgi:hypothetical protein